MKPLSRVPTPTLYHVADGKQVAGPHKGLRGDCTYLWGDCTDLRGDCTNLRGICSDLWGDCTNLRGDCTGLWGDCTNLKGDLDAIPMNLRTEGVDLSYWIE